MLGYGFLTAVLLASMYASHTLIAYPIISRYGLSRLRSVNITIGGTAVTVTLALIILAVIGIRKVSQPNTKLFVRFFLKSSIYISRPARNKM